MCIVCITPTCYFNLAEACQVYTGPERSHKVVQQYHAVSRTSTHARNGKMDFLSTETVYQTLGDSVYSLLTPNLDLQKGKFSRQNSDCHSLLFYGTTSLSPTFFDRKFHPRTKCQLSTPQQTSTAVYTVNAETIQVPLYSNYVCIDVVRHLNCQLYSHSRVTVSGSW